MQAVTSLGVGPGVTSSKVLTAPPGLSNVALNSIGAIATASLGFNGLTQPVNVIDGLRSTSWSSALDVPEAWIRLDLGRTFKVESIIVQWVGHDQPSAFKFMSSADGTTFAAFPAISCNCDSSDRRDVVDAKQRTFRYLHLLTLNFCHHSSSPSQKYTVMQIEVLSKVWEPFEDALDVWSFDSPSRYGRMPGTVSGNAELKDGKLLLAPHGKFSAVATEDIQSWSLSTWIFTSNIHSSCRVMAIQTADGLDYDAIMYGKRQWYLETSSQLKTHLGGAKETMPRWVHVAAVYSQGNSVLYVNGMRYGEPDSASANRASSTLQKPHVILGGGECAAQLSQASIWSRALSDSEVRAIFQTGKSPHGVPDSSYAMIDATWDKAQDHCQKRCKRLCRASELCPKGALRLDTPDSAFAWAPTGDTDNSWINVRSAGDRDVCALYHEERVVRLCVCVCVVS